MKHVVLMCLLLYTHTSQSEIFNQNVTEGADAFLYCKHEGEVLWSKDRDGNRFDILTARAKEEIQKHNTDPDKRYSALDDLSLHIKKVSISDSGIYYCNETPTVNLTVTSSDKPQTTTSITRSQSAATSSAATPNSTLSSESSSVTDFKSSQSTTHTQRTSTTNKPQTTTSTTRSQQGATSSPAATSISTLSSESSSVTDCMSSQSTTHTQGTSTIKKPQTTTSTTRNQSAATSSPVSIGTAAAVSGAAVFLVLILMLWACMKRKSLSAALAKKENIYETVDDNNSTAQPVPPQNTKDIIYYLAGDPDIVKLGQRQETDEHTYTLISGSQSKDNLTEQGQDVPLYSTIK